MIDYEGLILDQAEMFDNGECPVDDCEHCPYVRYYYPNSFDDPYILCSVYGEE